MNPELQKHLAEIQRLLALIKIEQEKIAAGHWATDDVASITTTVFALDDKELARMIATALFDWSKRELERRGISHSASAHLHRMASHVMDTHSVQLKISDFTSMPPEKWYGKKK